VLCYKFERSGGVVVLVLWCLPRALAGHSCLATAWPQHSTHSRPLLEVCGGCPLLPLWLVIRRSSVLPGAAWCSKLATWCGPMIRCGLLVLCGPIAKLPSLLGVHVALALAAMSGLGAYFSSQPCSRARPGAASCNAVCTYSRLAGTASQNSQSVTQATGAMLTTALRSTTNVEYGILALMAP
jgi:hypothetical protein